MGSESTACPLFRGCPLLGGITKCTIPMGSESTAYRCRPLLGGNKCTITMGSEVQLIDIVLFSEVTNVLSLWEVKVQLIDIVLFSEVTNVQLVLCSEVVLTAHKALYSVCWI